MSGPVVTLVFPVYNQVALLRRALETLNGTALRDFTVHVVDDGSEESVEGAVEQVRSKVSFPIRFDRLPRTGNSTVVVNWACLRATTDIVAYMNSDIEFPDPEWLGSTLSCFDRFREETPYGVQEVGAVGIKQVFPPGSSWGGQVGHVGNRFRKDGTWEHLEEFVSEERSTYREDGLVEGVTGCGLFTPTRIWREVGGFAIYPVYGWDDNDYCLRMHMLGYRVVCQRQHPIYHVRSASYGTPRNPLYAENKDLVRMRFGPVIDRLIAERGAPCAT